MIDTLDEHPVASEGLLVLESKMTDEICELSCSTAAFRLPEDQGAATVALFAGTYVFLQLPYAPEAGASLMPLLNRFALSLDYGAQRSSRLYVRLYKESRFKIAVQFIAPGKTRGD